MPVKDTAPDSPVEITATIVSAYVANNPVATGDLARFVASIGDAVVTLRPERAAPTRLSEAQIRESIGADYLVSFIDGRKYKLLRRHLRAHGLTPDAYRRRFGLPADYPVVCTDYSARRSRISRERWHPDDA
ncbi:MucR family transcriptional regulator [Methylobacterium oryzisoli]|uniref:MucR family transcriptional regulator n=1 Tax=Methylobacterium oryzisoli TaxID=3385502 RepID=UPI003891C8E9